MNSISERICTKCGELKSKDEFSKTHKSLCLLCLEDVIKDFKKPVEIGGFVREFFSKRKNNKDRFVYILSGGDLVKIGITDNVKKRVAALNLSSPVPISLIYSWFVKDAADIERRLHVHFHSKRIRGEWFDLSEDDIQWIISNFS